MTSNDINMLESLKFYNESTRTYCDSCMYNENGICKNICSYMYNQNVDYSDSCTEFKDL